MKSTACMRISGRIFTVKHSSTTAIRLLSSQSLSSSSVKISTPSSIATNSVAAISISIDDVKERLRTAQAVCFDVDSTVIQDEGIDVLAEFNGAGAAVAELTRKAMGGSVKFEDALAARLALINPKYDDITRCLQAHPPRLTKGIDVLIEKLHARGTAVYLVSGGFRQMINPIAHILKVPLHRIYANNLLFHSDGAFKGFDDKEPTSRDGGKPAVIQMLKDNHGYKPIIMVGDGATDLQARPPADAFIGFGGIVVRDKVKNEADWFVLDFDEMIDIVSK